LSHIILNIICYTDLLICQWNSLVCTNKGLFIRFSFRWKFIKGLFGYFNLSGVTNYITSYRSFELYRNCGRNKTIHQLIFIFIHNYVRSSNRRHFNRQMIGFVIFFKFSKSLIMNFNFKILLYIIQNLIVISYCYQIS
jgi:hypothetical protein